MADLTCLALCAGIGGLERGVASACGGLRVLGYVERDAYAAAVLLARMDDAALEPAPIWCGNLEELDARPFAGVDLLTAGIPCQPFSVAGKRKRLDDERWIWPDVYRIIRECSPRFVFLENVPGFLSHGAGSVLGDLAGLGYDAEWDCFSAADVGAPHRRKRWFCLAHARRASAGADQLRGSGWKGWAGATDVGVGGSLVADATHERHERGWTTRGRRAGSADDCGAMGHADIPRTDPDSKGRGSRPTACESSCDLGDPDLARLEGRSLALASRADERPTWPPGPEDRARWAEYIRAGGPEPAIRRSTPGLPARMDRLRCLGNAVVPAQAALAWRTLYDRLGRRAASPETPGAPHPGVIPGRRRPEGGTR